MAALDNVVRRSGMSVSDDERLEMVTSYYVAAQRYVRAVSDAVTRANTIHQEVERWRRTDDGRRDGQAEPDLISGRDKWLGEGVRSMTEARINLTALSTATRAVPNPTSAEARHARASLIQALRLYIRCARQVRNLLSDLGGKFGKNYARGGFYETRRTAMEIASLKRLVDSAGMRFETAARIMDREGCDTRLVEPQLILKPHSSDPSTTIEVPNAQGDGTDESRRQGGEHECLGERTEIDRLNCPAPSSDSAGDAEPLPVFAHFGSGASVGRRDMAQKSLLQQMEEIASRVRLLEREKAEAVARIQVLESENRNAVVKTRALEREVGELAAIITQAGDKADEILKIGANDENSQPPAVSVPKESKFREQLGEFSADPQREPKEGSVRPWRSE